MTKYFNARLAQKHDAQIAALTDPGLDDEERIKRFGIAAGFDLNHFTDVRAGGSRYGSSAAFAVWRIARCPDSLFANLPGGCGCPVIEVTKGRHLPGIPDKIPINWQPTIETLRRFSEIQQVARADHQ